MKDRKLQPILTNSENIAPDPLNIYRYRKGGTPLLVRTGKSATVIFTLQTPERLTIRIILYITTFLKFFVKQVTYI